MGLLQILLQEAAKFLTKDDTSIGNQSNNEATIDSFSHDHAIYSKWCEITDMNSRRKEIAQYLVTLNHGAYENLQANLEQMKQNVISHIQQHEANEKYAWGRYIEDQIAYQNAKLRTGARDPKFMQKLNEYNQSLETVNWTIYTCDAIWRAIKKI